MKKHRNDKRGITLVELMVSLSILLILLPTVYTFQNSLANGYDSARDSQQKQRAAQSVAAVVETDLRNAVTLRLVSAAQPTLEAGNWQVYADETQRTVLVQQAGETAARADQAYPEVPVTLVLKPVRDEADNILAAVAYTVQAGTEKPVSYTGTLYLPNLDAASLTALELATSEEGYGCAVYTLP